MGKFKLNYNPTYTFTLADIFDAGDNDITFESQARLDPDWASLCQAWIKNDSPKIEDSLEIVGMGILRVTQGDNILTIENEKDAETLMAAIEDDAPGHGQLFIEHLVIGHWNLHFTRLDERMGKQNGSEPE